MCIFCAKVHLFFHSHKKHKPFFSYFCMMNRFFSHFRRLPRSRGFGVQSPSDYHFVTRVLRRPIPQDVLLRMPRGKDERQLARLVYLLQQECETRGQEADLRVEDLACLTPEDVDRLMTEIRDDSCLILTHLRHSKSTLAIFRQLVSHPRRKITFDLYSLAVVIPNAKRYPQHYAINF